ncbi:MAG: L,D-transpeptidase [Actinobacteria bacterium]|nr:L,D-transpeptidase [Actinomycetota bacterium]
MSPSPARAGDGCALGRAAPLTGAGDARVGGPTPEIAWRAGLFGRTALYRGLPGAGGVRVGGVTPRDAPWLLVLRAVEDRGGRCWLKVRLPSRPNRAAAWLSARRVVLRPSPWRLAVSRAHRTVTVYRDGAVVRRLEAVVGAAATPTPGGLFSIVGAWPSPPDAFVGSWVLGLTAHSDVLHRFEGGSGEVGIHGRGGAGLVDPLGTAASHGCIRLANRAIDWLVQTVGREGLPGIPVRVR